MRAPAGDQGGFTMIEVMIAIVLLALATTGLIGLFRIQTGASSFSRHATEASSLAQDKLEVLRTQSAPASGSETALSALGKPGGPFDRSWVVTPSATYIDYAVTVTWDESGTARSIRLSSRRSL
jgi:prepilin-type N-terminal cleavage/methylation domain-containing protein